MSRLADALIRQAYIAPLAMLPPIVIGLFVADYNWLAQHMSELQLRAAPIAWTIRIGAATAGVSVFLFAVGCLFLRCGVQFSWTFLAAALFGAGMVGNGVFPIGSPLHGLYGLPIFMSLVPAFFVAEFPRAAPGGWFRHVSLASAFVSLAYLWGMLIGIEPEAYRGATQRAATLVTFGWYAAAAFAVHQTPASGGRA
ncbi:MAG: DUF998 domain-containing protein [Pseudomonadota bacterium]